MPRSPRRRMRTFLRRSRSLAGVCFSIVVLRRSAAVAGAEVLRSPGPKFTQCSLYPGLRSTSAPATRWKALLRRIIDHRGGRAWDQLRLGVVKLGPDANLAIRIQRAFGQRDLSGQWCIELLFRRDRPDEDKPVFRTGDDERAVGREGAAAGRGAGGDELPHFIGPRRSRRRPPELDGAARVGGGQDQLA